MLKDNRTQRISCRLRQMAVECGLKATQKPLRVETPRHVTASKNTSSSTILKQCVRDTRKQTGESIPQDLRQPCSPCKLSHSVYIWPQLLSRPSIISKKKKWLSILHIPAYLPWHFNMLLADFGQEQGIKGAGERTRIPTANGNSRVWWGIGLSKGVRHESYVRRPVERGEGQVS